MEELTFIVRLRDRATRGMKRLGTNINQLGASARRAGAALRSTGTGLNRFGRTARRVSRRVGRSTNAMFVAFTRLRSVALLLGGALAAVGLGVGLTVGIKVLKEYGFEMSRLSAVTGATGVQLAALNRTARQLGATTVFRAVEVAEGMRLLGQAGFETNEILRAIPATLNLAEVGALDLGTATSIVASTIKGFMLSASQAERVVDILANTSVSTNTTVQELGEGLKFVSAVAADFDVSLEETVGALGALADAGLRGTIAGTGLRRVLIGLVNITPKGAEALEDMKVNMDLIDPRANSLATVFEELANKNLTAAEAFKLFGLRGGPAALILVKLRKRAKDLADANGEAAGSARALAEIMRNNLRGDLKLLQSAFEELILQQGAFEKGLRDIIQTSTGVLQSLTGTLSPLDKNAEKYNELASEVRGAWDALSGLATLLRNLARPITAPLAALGDMISAFGRAQGVFDKLKVSILGLANVGAELITLGGLFGTFEPDKFDLSEPVNHVENFNGVIERNLELLGDYSKLRGTDLVAILPDLQNTIDGTVEQFVSLNIELEKVKKQADKQSGTFLGRLGFNDAADEAAQLQIQLHTLEKQLETLGGLAITGRTAEAAKEAEKQAEAALVRSANKAHLTIKDLVDSAEKSASSNLTDLAFEIDQLKLGAGAEADLQREINSKLRSSDLLVEIPVSFGKAREQLNKEIAVLQKKAHEARVGGNKFAFDAAQKGIAANKDAHRQLDEELVKRSALRKKTEDQVAALENAKRASAAAAQAAAEHDKIIESLATEVGTGLKDGIVAAFTEGASAGEVFRRTLFNIAGQIAQLAIQELVINRITKALKAMNTASSGGTGGGESTGGFFSNFAKGLGSVFSTPGSTTTTSAASEGGLSTNILKKIQVPTAAFANAKRFKEGGLSSGTDRIPALLSPNEAVVPLSRGREIPVDIQGARPIQVSINVTGVQNPKEFEDSEGQLGLRAANAIQQAQRRNG